MLLLDLDSQEELHSISSKVFKKRGGEGYIWSYWNNTVYSFIVEFLRFIPVLTVRFCILLMHSSRMAESDPYLEDMNK